MINHAQARLTPEEYLDAERRAALRSEYHAGEVLMMAGASYAHNVIVANLITELGSRLRGGSCIVLPVRSEGMDRLRGAFCISRRHRALWRAAIL